jgi:dipeptidyl aminopeptidase/acylaminoacyl peptidase
MLAAIVLGAGAYDFFSWYPARCCAGNIRVEAGTSPEVFRDRSAIYHVEKIKAPVLLLHGVHDERIPWRQSEAFADKLKSNGTTVQLKIFPGNHSIPIADQYREVYPFLDQYLR